MFTNPHHAAIEVMEAQQLAAAQHRHAAQISSSMRTLDQRHAANAAARARTMYADLIGRQLAHPELRTCTMHGTMFERVAGRCPTCITEMGEAIAEQARLTADADGEARDRADRAADERAGV